MLCCRHRLRLSLDGLHVPREDQRLLPMVGLFLHLLCNLGLSLQGIGVRTPLFLGGAKRPPSILESGSAAMARQYICTAGTVAGLAPFPIIQGQCSRFWESLPSLMLHSE